MAELDEDSQIGNKPFVNLVVGELTKKLEEGASSEEGSALTGHLPYC